MNRVSVEVYLNSNQAVKDLWEQFDTYFSGKYTVEKRQPKMAIWKESGRKMVKMQEVSKDKDFGLRLTIGANVSATL